MTKYAYRIEYDSSDEDNKFYAFIIWCFVLMVTLLFTNTTLFFLLGLGYIVIIFLVGIRIKRYKVR